MNRLYEVGGDTLYRHTMEHKSNEGPAVLAVQLSQYKDLLVLWEHHRTPNESARYEYDEVPFRYEWVLVNVFDLTNKYAAIEAAVDHAQSIGP